MALLARMTNTLGVAHNENTLALANMNFDFSLFRFDAPTEFQALGNNISNRRRQEGEGGGQHRTARRLAALFEGVLLPIPEFSRAYGRRVSQISESQRQNPRGSDSGGPFADHMGADGTAIWAAATSGPNAVPVLLLGCLLARIWSGPEATSLWVELVDRRRREIQDSCTDVSMSHFMLIRAAQQEITRSNLADWDASTRAWLQTADDVRQLQQTQLMLIINNLQMPVSSNMAVYQSVIQSVNVAFSSMENLFNGAAQRVQHAAFLLGLSAWHIYPDMIVHGATTKSIKQEDELVPEGSVITLGLQSDDNLNQGIYWSLPLAHLRFYGDPVQSTRSTGLDASRVLPQQLVYIALGALFSAWFDTSKDTPKGLQWLRDLSEFLDRAEPQAEKDGDKKLGRKCLRRLSLQKGWLGMLMNTVVAMSQMTEIDREKANKLLALGYRRYKEILATSSQHQPSYFGLLKTWNLFPMLKTNEDRISVLRSFAKQDSISGGDHIIVYKRAYSYSDKVSFVEFATVDPLPLKSTFASLPMKDEQPRYRHKRWIALNWNFDATYEDGIQERKFLMRLKLDTPAVCRCGDNCDSTCPCREFSDGCLYACSCQGKGETCRTPGSVPDELRDRIISIRSVGEDCVVEHPRLFLDQFRHLPLRVKQKGKPSQDSAGTKGDVEHNYHVQLSNSDDKLTPVRSWSSELYDEIRSLYKKVWDSRKSEVKMVSNLREGPWLQAESVPVHLTFRYGNPKTAAIYSVSRPLIQEDAVADSRDVTEEELQRLFRADAINPLYLQHYLATLEISKEGYGNCITSLKALASIVTVYESLPGATVALTVAAKPLHDPSFIKHALKAAPLVEEQTPMTSVTWSETDKRFKQDRDPFPSELDIPTNYVLDLASKFACIALCEYGVHQIDPTLLQHVFAVSSRNSIFVAAPLLDDPGHDVTSHDIRRVIGNIGRAGIAMMIPPQAPRTRSAELESWELINHAPFDGKPADSFQNTSLHLSFTQYTMPIHTGTHGAQDTETFLIESPISVYDRQCWVADIDILSLFQSEHLSRYHRDCSHPPHGENYRGLISIDNWEELLDREKVDSVVRAYQNPQARLATATISVRQGHHTVIVSDEACWACIMTSFGIRATFIQ